jgi:stearoyl-CoA desaturase (delta-9 desaturase)
MKPLSPRRRRWLRLKWATVIWVCLIQCGIVLAPFAFSWSGVAVCAILYALTGLGITMGFHRLLTHRSFQTPKFVEYCLALLGSLANQGGPLAWVAAHRVHHQHSDRQGDPHSPREGWWWAHMLWWMAFDPVLDEPRHYRRFVIDLARDPVYRLLHHGQVALPVALAAILYCLGEWYGGLGFSWLVWGIFVRTTLLLHTTWLVNSATHRWGYRSHPTPDSSTNLWWVALLTFGEGWHNNHHAHPRSARHGLRWWEIDVTYYLIRMFSWVALARNIYVPGKVLAQRARVLARSVKVVRAKHSVTTGAGVDAALPATSSAGDA